MKIDISCRKCGQRRRLEIGDPKDVSLEEHLRLMVDRLTHRPSFQCFGGHFELSPALPGFWEIHWDSLGD